MLWIVGTFLLEKDDRPEGKDTAAFVAWVEKNDTAIIAGAFVFGLGVVLFVWMLGSLRSVLFAAEGGTGRLATIAFGSGIATAISMMFTYFPQAQAAFDVDDTSETSTDALVHVGDAFFGGVELFAIPLTAATALVILRYGALPRWFAWLSLALALILVDLPDRLARRDRRLATLDADRVGPALYLRPAGEPAPAARPRLSSSCRPGRLRRPGRARRRTRRRGSRRAP